MLSKGLTRGPQGIAEESTEKMKGLLWGPPFCSVGETLEVYTLAGSCSLSDKNSGCLLSASHCCTTEVVKEVPRSRHFSPYKTWRVGLPKVLSWNSSVQNLIIREMVGAIEIQGMKTLYPLIKVWSVTEEILTKSATNNISIEFLKSDHLDPGGKGSPMIHMEHSRELVDNGIPRWRKKQHWHISLSHT